MATNEHIIKVPGRIKNSAVGGHVAGAEDIFDDALNKKQSAVNQELLSADTTLDGKITIEKNRAEAAEELLRQAYEALTQSDIVVGDLPASGEVATIYRVPGESSYKDYMWDGTQFVEMAEYDNAIDDEPTAESNNLVKSGGVAAVYGEYISNPEFIKVSIDNKDKLLYGVKNDGDFYFGKGIPSQIKKELNNKVDSEEEKSLINEKFAESVSSQENIDFFQVTLDSKDRVLEGLKVDGTKFLASKLLVEGNARFNDGILIDGKITFDGAADVTGFTYDVVESQDWLMAVTDANDRILYGVRKDGTFYAKTDADKLESTVTDFSKQGLYTIDDNDCRNVINPNVFPVNNVKYHAANEADIWVNSKTGFMYAVYPENDTTYYETTGRIGMSVFSMATPWNVKHYEVCKTGDAGVNGTPCVAYLCPLESEGKLRVFVAILNNHKYQYKDFDLATETFSEWHYLKYNGSNLTTEVIAGLIRDAGYTIDTGNYVRSETMYNNAKDGYCYQVFSTMDRNGDIVAIFKSDDNWTTCEYVGVFPYEIRFNSIMDYYDGTFYFLYRKKDETGFSTDAGVYLTTTEDFETYTEPVFVGSMDMRPDIFVRGNNVYLVVGDKRNQGDGFYRTNMHIFKGTGSTIDGYTKILNVTDDRGMVNPRARLFGDDIHILVSNSPIRLDKENGYYTPVSSSPQYQGKECECYIRVRMT